MVSEPCQDRIETTQSFKSGTSRHCTQSAQSEIQVEHILFSCDLSPRVVREIRLVRLMCFLDSLDEKKTPAMKPGPGLSGRRRFLELGAEDEVGSFLGLGGGLDDERFVILQLLQPVLEVGGGVLHRGFDAGVTAQERCAHFGDEFFLAIRIRAKTG